MKDEFEMRPKYADDFLTPIGAIRFDRDKGAKLTGFGIFAGRVRSGRFRRE